MRESGTFVTKHRGDNFYTYTELQDGEEINVWRIPIPPKLSKAKQIKLQLYCGKVKIGHLALRFKVLERDNFRCRYCGRGSDEVKLQIDHIIPRSKGGLDSLANLVTACRDCNLGKGNKIIQRGN